MTATLIRHDPPSERMCLDEFRDIAEICVCYLPEDHTDAWHECRCGARWTTARIHRVGEPHA